MRTCQFASRLHFIADIFVSRWRSLLGGGIFFVDHQFCPHLVSRRFARPLKFALSLSLSLSLSRYSRYFSFAYFPFAAARSVLAISETKFHIRDVTLSALFPLSLFVTHFSDWLEITLATTDHVPFTELHHLLLSLSLQRRFSINTIPRRNTAKGIAAAGHCWDTRWDKILNEKYLIIARIARDSSESIGLDTLR